MGACKSKSAAKAGEPAPKQEATVAEPRADLLAATPTAEEKAVEPAAAEASAVETAAEASTEPAAVKVEIIGAKGLRSADAVGKSEAYCTVELAGKPESKAQTGTATDPKEPQWNHVVEVSGYRPGDSLTFTVKDSDPLKDDILGRATLTVDQVKAGFAGDLPLVDAGDGVEAFLHVRVEGTDPTLLDKAAAEVEEVKEAIAETADDAREVLGSAGDKAKELAKEAKELANEVVDEVKELAHKAEEVIEDEAKSMHCRC
jgi:ElaB/YqjD/DUF883 family membrane-anchored ribosome-binding protein